MILAQLLEADQHTASPRFEDFFKLYNEADWYKLFELDGKLFEYVLECIGDLEPDLVRVYANPQENDYKTTYDFLREIGSRPGLVRPVCADFLADAMIGVARLSKIVDLAAGLTWQRLLEEASSILEDN
jgi:hypothetical protein